MIQIRIHGRGGQGVVSGAELLSVAAFHEGRHAQAFPSFGSERMGAPVMAFCRIDDKEVRLREPVLDPDALIIQDPTLLHQVDLFGGISRAIEAGRADVGAVQAAFDNTRISVAAETTRAYADACSAGQQLAVARESLRLQEETFALTRRQFEGGRGTALETGQAGAQLEQVRAALPTLEAERRAALFRLAVLTGRPPVEE